MNKLLIFSLISLSINHYSTGMGFRQIIIEHMHNPHQPIAAWADQLPLDIAVSEGECLSLIPALLSNGAIVTSRTLRQATLAWNKKNLNRLDALKLLVAHLAINQSDEHVKNIIDESRVLGKAVLCGNIPVADCLLAYNPNVNIQDEIGLTPLHYSMVTEYIRPESNKLLRKKELLRKLLVERRANPLIKDNFGRTPVAFAQGMLNSYGDPHACPYYDFLTECLSILKPTNNAKL